ncbi:GGDEF domain-containing protein [Candidatus Woesearchaeota archaeon]|nr:GGDEF domain-containing protein [Candidatus Woesearchaeota archaeon]
MPAKMSASDVFGLLSDKQKLLVKDFDARLRSVAVHEKYLHELSGLLADLQRGAPSFFQRVMGRGSARLRVKALDVLGSIRQEVLAEFSLLLEGLVLDAGMERAVSGHDAAHGRERFQTVFHDASVLSDEQEAAVLRRAAEVEKVARKLGVIMKGEREVLKQELDALVKLEQELGKEAVSSTACGELYARLQDAVHKLSLWVRVEQEECMTVLDVLVRTAPSMDDYLAKLGARKVAEMSFGQLLVKAATAEDVAGLMEFVVRNKARLPAGAVGLVKARGREIARMNAIRDASRQAIFGKGVEFLQTVHEQEIVKNTDALTEVWNRRYFDRNMPLIVAKYLSEVFRSQNKVFSFAMVDIDHFKDVNDTFGHQVGDRVLKEIAKWIKGKLRQDDLIFRYGGEEFSLVIFAPVSKAVERCEQVRKYIEGTSEAAAKAGLASPRFVPKLTVSIGVAEFPTDGSDLNMLVALADAAMYSVKKSTRNRVQHVTAEIKARVTAEIKARVSHQV